MWWHLTWELFLRIPSGKPLSTAFTTPPIPLPTDWWMEFSKVLPSFEFSCPHLYPYSPLYLWWTNNDNNWFEPSFYFYYYLISRASSIPGFPVIVSSGMGLLQFIFACSFRYRFFLILLPPCYLSTVFPCIWHKESGGKKKRKMGMQTICSLEWWSRAHQHYRMGMCVSFEGNFLSDFVVCGKDANMIGKGWMET